MVYELLDIMAIIITTASATGLVISSKKNKMIKHFMGCQIMLVIWAVSHLLEIYCENIVQQTIINDVGYFAVCYIGVKFFIFTLYYTDSDLAKNKLLKFIMCIPSTVLYVLLLLNPIFGLFFEKYEYQERVGGIGFYLTVFVTYIFIFAGMACLLYKNIKSYKVRKQQIYLISLAVIIPVIINFLSVFVGFQQEHDLTPISFSLSSILIIIAIYKYDLMDVNPNGIKHIIDRLNQHILIFDDNSVITYVNKSFWKVFKVKLKVYKTDMTRFLNVLLLYTEKDSKKNLIKLLSGKNAGETEVNFKVNNKRHIYHIEKSYVYNEKGKTIGCTVAMSNVTEYYNMLDELEKKNNKLIEANSKLVEMNLISQQLAVEKERRKIAQDLHDTLGHSLVSVMTLIKLAMMNEDKNNKGTLEQALALSENLLADVRTVVSGLPESEKISLVAKLNMLIENLGDIKDKVELTIIGTEEEKHYFAVNTLFSAVRESITNAFKHGNADRVDVIIKFRDASITVFIIDNGSGCDNINKHMGLNGMEKKVYDLGGTIEFTSNADEGFNVHIEIPVVM